MGCAPFPNTRLLAVWTLLLLPFVNGAVIRSSAGYCSSNAFWYDPVQDCIPLGSRSFQATPPYGIACPSEGWYWSSQRSVCLPSNPVTGTVSCPFRYTWDAAKSECLQVGNVKRSAAHACGTSEFWFHKRATCLPRRSISPATSTQCPSGWYLNEELRGCAPANPEVLSSTVKCGGGSVWSPSAMMCRRAAPLLRRSPSPSGGPSPSPQPSRTPPPWPSRSPRPWPSRSPSPWPSRLPSPRPSSPWPSRSPSSPSSAGQLSRRSGKTRAPSLCPANLQACPISTPGDLSDYECVDPKYDLQHCGGCSTDGRGEDCTSIKGAWNVACVQARCSVLTCAGGYTQSLDKRSCVKL